MTLGLCAFALSAVLPSFADSKVRSALVTASGAGPGALDRAQASAEFATSLDPLSDAGLKVEATIAVRRRQPRLARSYLLDAIRRNPSDPEAWSEIAYVELLLGDIPDARRAANAGTRARSARPAFDEPR